ncbi:MAG: caspase family protein [Alphaproteobacteria bacterium]|nr:caspase family protein [Alphaproteobacteria bacterium]
MRWAAFVLAAVLVLAAGMGDAQAPPVKLALVIGNADYDGDARIDASAAGAASSESRGFVPDLRNPLNDAGDIRDALTRIGFRVDHVTNADGAAMSAALAAFGTKVAAAPDTAQVVVYYAGHAIQVYGANFVIPVKAQLPAADFANMPTNQVQTILRRVAVSTTEITEQLKQLRAPGVNLLLFDACRNNPWETRVRGIGRSTAATRGLAEIAAPPRTIIAFATAPGRTASDGGERNSPFAAALKTWVGKPGTILQTLDGVGEEVQTATGGRQTPWFQSASVGRVCLSSCSEEGGSASRLPALPAGHFRLDFSAASGSDPPRHVVAAEPYLRSGPVRVTISSRTPAGSVIVFQNNQGAYGGRAIVPTVSQNFLTQINTDNTPSSYAMAFSRPLRSFTFQMPQLYAAGTSGVTFPQWKVVALAAGGAVVATAEDGIRGSYDDSALQRHTLSGAQPIVSVRVESYSYKFAAFETALIEEIAVEPVQ